MNTENNYYIVEFNNDDIIFTPKEGYDKVLIWLPGLGDTAKSYYDDILDERRPVPNKMKVIILTAPVNKNNKHSWYDYISNRKVNENSYSHHVERITKVIDSEALLLKNDYSKVFLGGFSQGSCMSFLIGLTDKVRNFGGIICCSGFFFDHIKPLEGRNKLPILICHGTKDNIISISYAMETYKHLIDGGYNITYKTYEFAHELTWAEYKDIKEFIENNVNSNQSQKF